jgi:hypothetical protein
VKVLVCGGRYYGDWEQAYKVLGEIREKRGITVVIHGDAVGADRIAGDWANGQSLAVIKCPADWDRHGRAAGPIRNQKMLDDHHPELVVAFAGGRGTADMVCRAKAAGIEVMEVSPR